MPTKHADIVKALTDVGYSHAPLDSDPVNGGYFRVAFTGIDFNGTTRNGARTFVIRLWVCDSTRVDREKLVEDTMDRVVPALRCLGELQEMERRQDEYPVDKIEGGRDIVLIEFETVDLTLRVPQTGGSNA